MNITLVAAGEIAIPPQGYGGVELVVWNLRNTLVAEEHSVNIVNVMDGKSNISKRWRILCAINASSPDVVHIHASKYFNLARFIRCPNILFSDHSPGVAFADYKYHSRAKIKETHTLCFSKNIKELYAATGIHANFLHVIPNGIVVDEYSFTESPKRPDKTICLGVISKRKRQYALSEIADIDFAGPIHEQTFFPDGAYQGEWSRDNVQQKLTEYANLVLLTDAEVAAPLVCLEALAGGLGLVIAKAAADNLDTSLPFIDIIPEHKIHDREFVATVIAENRTISLAMRKQIREYAKTNFDTKQIVKTKYLPLLSAITGSGNL